jgi:hypothetical protein
MFVVHSYILHAIFHYVASVASGYNKIHFESVSLGNQIHPRCLQSRKNNLSLVKYVGSLFSVYGSLKCRLV